MKALLLSFLFVFVLCTTVSPQWTLKHTFTNAENLWMPYAVDENIYWGILHYSLSPSLGGYFRTTDGGSSWQQDTLPYPGITALHPRNADVAYLGVQDVSNIWRIVKTTDGGLNWVIQNSAYGTSQSFIDFIYFFDDNNGVTIGDPVSGYLEIYTTTNGGDNWVKLPNTYIPQSLSGEFPINLCFTTLGNTIWIPVVIFGNNQFRVFKTTDKGLSWTVSNQFSGDIIPSSIAFKNQNEGILITSSFFVSSSSTYQMLKTTDGGNLWTEMNFPLSIDPAFICNIPGTLQGYFVSAPVNNIGSAYTLDGGINWQLIDIIDLCFPQFLSPSSGWSGGWNNNAIYKWSGPPLPVELTSFSAISKGKEVILNWSTASELNNLGFEIQRSFEGNEFATIGVVYGKGTTNERHDYSYIDKNLVDGKYFYRLKQIDYIGSYEFSDVVEIEITSPAEFILAQNYPNPFNSSSVIKYSIPKSSRVTLKIFNALGQELETLINEEKSAGRYEVDFNAADLPSGVYFYRLQAGDFVETKKMILMK